MKAYTYIEKGKFALTDKPKPELKETTDAIVRVTLSSICTSDLHIKHGSVPRAVPYPLYISLTILNISHLQKKLSSPVLKVVYPGRDWLL